MRRTASYLLLAFALTACGDEEQTVPDEIEPEEVYAARCQSPRTGTDPFTGDPFRDEGGSLLDEQLWLRSWTDNTYLWYQDVPRLDPRNFATPVDYFDELKSNETTTSGRPKDNFHFSINTADWVAQSRSGVVAGYGFQLVLIRTAPPRKGVIAYVDPNTPAAMAGLDRGAEIKSVDGVDLESGNDVNTLNRGLFPSEPGESHIIGVVDRGTTTVRQVMLTSAMITTVPVQNVKRLPAPHQSVGYMVFNDFIATAERGLFDAITQLAAEGVTDLVLDLRYNGGGYLAIASQLGFMLAGSARTAGKIFEVQQFNDKHPTTDPVTGQSLTPDPFVDRSIGFSVEAGQPLPSLGLGRVFVLTGPGTCSASEAVMNGLAGIDVEVIQIGSTTCGKPYGFYPADNCGTTYFSIQFQGVNHKGFGDYPDGFVPGGSGIFPKSCAVADDFSHALGDPAEARLAAALQYRTSGTCPPVSTARGRGEVDLSAADGMVPKSIWRQNRIVVR